MLIWIWNLVTFLVSMPVWGRYRPRFRGLYRPIGFMSVPSAGRDHIWFCVITQHSRVSKRYHDERMSGMMSFGGLLKPALVDTAVYFVKIRAWFVKCRIFLLPFAFNEGVLFSFWNYLFHGLFIFADHIVVAWVKTIVVIFLWQIPSLNPHDVSDSLKIMLGN